MLKSAEPVMEDAYLDMLAKDITPKTKCYTCGGDNHTSTQFLDDGTKVTCAKKIIEEHNQKVVKMVDEAADDGSKVFDATELQDVKSFRLRRLQHNEHKEMATNHINHR